MRITYHRYKDIGVTIYHLNKGEKVSRHVHPMEHTTACTAGRSQVEIDGDPPFEMTPDMPDYMLPAQRYHEIRALEDSTICIHIMSRQNSPDLDDSYLSPEDRERRRQQRGAGVLLVDGTVAYPD